MADPRVRPLPSWTQWLIIVLLVVGGYAACQDASEHNRFLPSSYTPYDDQAKEVMWPSYYDEEYIRWMQDQ